MNKINGAIRFLMVDFGGVVAEEGFREGLKAIAAKAGQPEDRIISMGFDAVHESGYVAGKATEKDFWKAFRLRTGIDMPDQELRGEILSRFVIRKWMLDILSDLRNRGTKLSLLTDQTDWLYELDKNQGFLKYFDYVFNSFRLGKTKRSRDIFPLVLKKMNSLPHETVFVDDHPGNIDRAEEEGLNVILFTGRGDFMNQLVKFFPSFPTR